MYLVFFILLYYQYMHNLVIMTYNLYQPSSYILYNCIKMEYIGIYLWGLKFFMKVSG